MKLTTLIKTTLIAAPIILIAAACGLPFFAIVACATPAAVLGL